VLLICVLAPSICLPSPKRRNTFVAHTVHYVRTKYTYHVRNDVPNRISNNRVVGLATKLPLRRSGVRIPAVAGDSSLLNVTTVSGAHPASFSGHRRCFPGVKRLGRETDHSHPSSAPPKFLCGADTTTLDEFRALVGYYAASSGSPSPTFRDNISVPSSRRRSLNLSVGRGLPLHAA
jgi:hypothetical protein